MSEEPERWAIARCFPAYSVSSHGRVRRHALTYGGGGSIRTPKTFIRQRALPLGHRIVTLSMNNGPKTFLVHRLVAEAFLPSPLPGQDCVLHKDDDPGNNRWDNLFWGTRTINSEDKVKKGRQARGEKISSAKLTNNQIQDIRRLCNAGENQRDIAKRFGVTQSNVSQIATGRTWSHIE